MNPNPIAKQINNQFPTISSQTGEELVLHIGQEVQIKNTPFSMTLKDLKDTRCRSDIECFWSGTVTAFLDIKNEGISTNQTPLEIDLVVNNIEPMTTNQSLAFVKVDPPPSTIDNPTMPKNYKATFRIQEAANEDIAILNMSVSIEGEYLAKVREKGNERIHKLIETMILGGIDQSDIKTKDYEIVPKPTATPNDESTKSEHYATMTLQVTVRNSRDVEDIITRAKSAGADSVEHWKL